MPETPEDFPTRGVVTTAIILPVVWEFDLLPYFPAHVQFADHADGCDMCHRGSAHREEFPEDTPDDELFCADGLELHDAVIRAIDDQRHVSAQN